jgi:AraC family transcriptional regulator, ethanolamine operon transcriptional activator
MEGSVMLTASRVDGFDEFAQDIRGAEVTIVLTGPSHIGWRIERFQSGELLLQFAVEAGERVLYGRAAPTLLGFATRASFDPVGERMNGRPFGPCDFAVMPPGADFLFSCSKPHEWIAVSLPVDSMLQQGHPLGDEQALCLSPVSTLITVPPALCQRFREAAFAARTALRFSATSADDSRTGDVAGPVIDALAAAIQGRTGPHDAPPDRLRDDERLVHGALRLAATDDLRGPPIDEIAEALGVGERTLLRAFENVLGMSTSQFLKKWKLNIVRREIVANPDKYQTVTHLLVEHGITELGRFAGEYRRLFAETPSATISRRRQDVQGSARTTALHPAVLAQRSLD